MSRNDPATRNTILGLAAVALLAAIPFLYAASPPATDRDERLFMDVHVLGPGNVTAEAVAEAHRQDLAIQDEYGVDYMSYWVDEESGRIFCLVSAPDAAAAEEVHRRSHGLVADEIHEVQPGE